MGGMTNEPRRRGPKPKGQPRRKVIGFGVSPEHHEWLTLLPNRSAWLAEQITKADGVDTHLAAAYLKVAYSDSQAQLNVARTALLRLADAVKAERATTQQTDAMEWAAIHTGLDTALAAAREVLDDPY